MMKASKLNMEKVKLYSPELLTPTETQLVVKNIMVCGITIKCTGKEHIITPVEISMKETGLMGKWKAKAKCNTPTAQTTMVNGKTT
jgi:hypothetical protein